MVAQFDSALTGEQLAFLHRMDSVTGEVVKVLTDRASLGDASFLDGRETFWRQQALGPLNLASPGPALADRFIFHVGFAGSTLLARLLQRPSQVLVLKEPQCLADIAGQRELIAAGKAVAPLGTLLDHALGEMAQAGDDDVALVVKPTNWVNSLLPDLCVPFRVRHAVFVTMERRAFLRACFRGGHDRLAFCTRLASQLAPVVPQGNAMLRAAIAAGEEPLARVARIVALLHWLQEWLFAEALARNGWPDSAVIDFDEIVADPASAVRRAQQHLALPELPCDPGQAALLMTRHTKDPSSRFQPDGRADEDRLIDEHHGATFDHALAWLDSATVGTR